MNNDFSQKSYKGNVLKVDQHKSYILSGSAYMFFDKEQYIVDKDSIKSCYCRSNTVRDLEYYFTVFPIKTPDNKFYGGIEFSWYLHKINTFKFDEIRSVIESLVTKAKEMGKRRTNTTLPVFVPDANGIYYITEGDCSRVRCSNMYYADTTFNRDFSCTCTGFNKYCVYSFKDKTAYKVDLFNAGLNDLLQCGERFISSYIEGDGRICFKGVSYVD